MKKECTLLYILSAVLAANIAGFILKYLELDTFFILLGFRIHLSLVIPSLFILGRLPLSLYKSEFADPPYKKNYPYVLTLILPLILFGFLYLVDLIKLADPEYFYEFGLSSIVDSPVYLIWNAAQLILFYFFLICVFERKKFRLPVLYFSAVSPFIYEFISPENGSADITGLAVLAITGITVSVVITKFRNIYWFVIFFFLTFWIFILFFGSASNVLINLLFASNYTQWEGFLMVNKSFEAFLLPVYSALICFLIFIFSLFRKKVKIIL